MGYLCGVIFGAHCSTSGGLGTALERAGKIGASVCQIFVKNNMQWFGRPFERAVADHFKAERARAKLPVFGHTGYLINLAASNGENREKSLKSFIQEIELAAQIDLPFLVLHPGAHLGAGEDAGLKQIAAGLNEAFRITKGSRVRIALENTAGQGSCLGCKLEHLARIYDRVDRSERLGVCLDTAHLFAAGYGIHVPRGWDAAIAELDSLLGIKEILAFHLNDSKTELNSRVDRHAHIGQGKIGREGFRHIVNDPRFREHPGCLETPKGNDLREDIENLAVLRSLAQGEKIAQRRAARPDTPPAAKPAARIIKRNLRRKP